MDTFELTIREELSQSENELFSIVNNIMDTMLMTS